jgi:heptaprenyl diphosphate synthase
MSSDARQITINPTREDYRIAWLTALAITIHIVESALPSPVPGIKPGLANVITIVVLLMYGWPTAAWVAMLRVVVGSLVIGTFLTPTFVLSFSGAVASITVLGIGSLLPGKGLGPIGYSLLASMAHMATQFTVAYLLFIPHPGLFKLLPVLMTASVVFGIVSGLVVSAIMNRIRE